jgi:SAM-dependent methyltransferase
LTENRSVNYSVIADYYDRIFTGAFDYDLLGRHLASVIAAFAPQADKFLELGAGTCPLARHSAFPKSATVVFSDLSPQMLARAGFISSSRVAADARALPFNGYFDVCVMVMDALNYLLEEESVLRCFSETLRALKPGGLFIVNIASESYCKKQFQDYFLEGRVDGRDYSLRSRYDGMTRRISTRISLFSGEPDNGPAQVEIHEQHIYDQAAIHRLARSAGFKVLGCFENHTLAPANEDSEVIHFALQKPDSETDT